MPSASEVCERLLAKGSTLSEKAAALAAFKEAGAPAELWTEVLLLLDKDLLESVAENLAEDKDSADEASTSDNWKFPVGSPSSDGLPGRFKELQSQPVGPLFLTHCPASAQAIPFALLEKGFALFLDVQAGRKGKPSLMDYQMTVELCDVASSLFDNEADRQVAVMQVLTQYLHCDYKRLKISLGKAGQPPQTDGTATVMRDGEVYPYQWGEFKLEVGQGGADPQAESVLYFFHFISRTNARTRRMLPGLMLEQFGAYIRISGIANVGAHVACEPLTPALHLLDLRPHQPDYMEQLAQMLRALRLTTQYYRNGYETGSLPKLEASPLPYVLRRSRDAALHGQAAGQNVLSRAELTSGALQLWKDRLLTPYTRQPDSDQLEESPGQLATADDTRMAVLPAPAAEVHPSAAAQPSFSSQEEGHADADRSAGSPGPPADLASCLPLAGAVKVQPGCQVPTKLLYKVSEPCYPDAVHKFTTRYSAEAHSALAAQHLAPELLAPVEQLPGGWFWVRMRLLDSPWRSLLCILQSGDLEPIRAAVAAAQVALARAHAIRLGKDSKLVWGDARPSNFLLRWLDDGTIDVRLIDFDWSGAEGAVAYPGYLNSQVPWAEGVRSHDPIVQTHDVELLRDSVCRELLERFGVVPDVMDSGAAAANLTSAQAGSRGSMGADVPRVQPEPNAGKWPIASQHGRWQSKPPTALLPASAPGQIFHAAAAPARRL